VHLDDVPREVLVAIAALAVVVLAADALKKWSRRARLRRRFVRAAEGEQEAAALLERHGYVIEGAQVAATYVVEVDGAPVEVALRADYLVSRGRELFVAEVKTGQIAPRIQAPATRRQLLEYHVAFGAHGVLLVDAEAGTVQRVVFPSPEGRKRSFGWAIAFALALAVTSLAALRWTGHAMDVSPPGRVPLAGSRASR
jgi:hypothetical protein